MVSVTYDRVRLLFYWRPAPSGGKTMQYLLRAPKVSIQAGKWNCFINKSTIMDYKLFLPSHFGK